MNWKIKAHTLAILSRSPGGNAVYHGLQRILGTNRLNIREALARCVDIVNLIREAGHDSVRGQVLEIGTGWRPFLPFVLSLLGAERVITFDVNPWLTRNYAFETYRALGKHIEQLAADLRVDPAMLRTRYARTLPQATDFKSLLDAFRIEYRCPANACQSGLPNGSIELVCSCNVLEHVSSEILGELHTESARVLKPGGLAVHRFNPGDHFAAIDKRITVANFVQFSAANWHWYGGSGLSYHNRLRCPDHAQLLEQAGFELAVNRVRGNERAAAAVRTGELPVHADYAKFTPDELAADYMWLVGRRSKSADRAPFETTDSPRNSSFTEITADHDGPSACGES
jgi:SAM-dependent methyltransferase